MKQIADKMRQMKLLGMLRAFQLTHESGKNEQLTADEMVSHLVDTEWDDRHNRKLERASTAARFRYKASIEQLDFEDNRIDKNQILRLADCDFVKRKEVLAVIGSTGVGKSYLVSALGLQACALGYRVLYQHSTKLFGRMKIAKADGTYLKELAKIERQHLLIIDDFGIQPLDAQSRATLMDIFEDRYEKASTIITSQIPISKWHDVIGEQTIADAILDRIVHNAHRIEMKGESLRKKKRPFNSEEIKLENLIN